MHVFFQVVLPLTIIFGVIFLSWRDGVKASKKKNKPIVSTFRKPY